MSILVITSKNGKGAYFDAVPKSVEGWRIFNVNLKGATEYFAGEPDFNPSVDLDELLDTLRQGANREPWLVLVHYDCFIERHNKNHGILDKFASLEWDFIACDEAHKLKNRDTSWTKNIKKLRGKHKHIMTGTGFVNNPAEMWSLLNWLDRTRWSSYWGFRNRFCDQYYDVRGYQVIVGLKKSRVPEFRAIREEYGPRHTMAEVHSGISHPIETVHEVELDSTQKRMYREIKAYLRTLDEAGEPLRSPNVLSQLNRLRQVCVATPKVVGTHFDEKAQRQVTEIELTEPSNKLDEVMSILDELPWDDESKPQVVVFSNFKGPLCLLEKRFEKAGIPYLHLQVQMNEQKRYEMWHDTFPKKQHRVLMSTLALGGESINLACAQYLIFLDRSWSPKDMMQAIGRVYRPGQTGVPEIIYINAKGTVDSYVKSKLDKKVGWFNDIFGDS